MRKKILFIACMSSIYLSSSVAFADEQKEKKSGFIEDSKLSFSARNVWLHHDVRNGGPGSGQTKEWGQGFVLTFESGFTEGTVGFGVDAVGTYGLRLDAGGKKGKQGVSRSSTQLFPLKSNNQATNDSASFGASAKIKVSNTVLQYGDTLRPNYPVIIANDARLLPQIYKGGIVTSKEIDGLTLVGGKLEHAKGRASTDMQPIAVRGAGTGTASNKFYFGGLDYTQVKDLTLQYYFANLKDFYKQHYVGGKYKIEMPAGALTPEFRYWYTTSDGKNSSTTGRQEGYTVKGINDGKVDNRTWNFILNYGIGNHTVIGSFQEVSGRSAFPIVDQGSVGSDGTSTFLANDILGNSFSEAGERSWLLGHTYNFRDFGLPGLFIMNRYAKGFNIKRKAGQNFNNKEWERDLIVGYKILEGTFKGLEFQWRNLSKRTGVGNDTDDNRIYVTYNYVFDKF